MKQAVENLKDPEVDQHEALAQLSEMQAALTSAMEQLDTQTIDAELQQLAEALQDANATHAASQSLKESNYEKAADELEKIEASTMNRKEGDAVASNLAKLSKNLGKGKKGKLSESIQEMAEGLSSEDSEQSKSGFCKAAGVCRQQGTKKRLANLWRSGSIGSPSAKGAAKVSAVSPVARLASQNLRRIALALPLRTARPARKRPNSIRSVATKFSPALPARAPASSKRLPAAKRGKMLLEPTGSGTPNIASKWKKCSTASHCRSGTARRCELTLNPSGQRAKSS